jgi:hypothetical protein
MTAVCLAVSRDGVSLPGKNCRVIMVNKTFLPGLGHPSQSYNHL